MAFSWRVFFILAAMLALASPSHANGNSESPAQIPILGIPYVSTTSDGSTFVGTIELERFESDGASLTATGKLRFKNRVLPREFPVELLRADCSVLELKVGPPRYRGLQDPIIIKEHPGASALRQADFCRIGQAFAAGDFDEVASELNEEDLLAAGFLGGNSCPWYDELNCESAVAVCGFTCAFSPGSCARCFQQLGVPQCIICLIN